MPKVRAKELRELSSEELRSRVAELEQAFFKRRLQKTLGQLEKPMQGRAARREYARVLTVLREREIRKEKP